MSGPPRLVNLTNLYFQVVKAVDNGRVATVREAHDALIDGQAMEFLDQYEEIDLSGFKDYDQMDLDNLSEDDKPQGWDWDEMNAMFERYVAADPHDLGVDNNGLNFILAQIVQLIQGDHWTHTSFPRGFDHWDMEIKKDW